MSAVDEPPLVLELKPGRRPIRRAAKHWSRWVLLVALIAVVGVVLAFGWVFGRHIQGYLYFRSKGAVVHWQKFDTTAESGTTVVFRHSGVLIEDQQLENLAFLYHLKMVDLGGCPHITDQGVALLARFEGLRELHLSRFSNRWERNNKDYVGPELTDAGLASLKGLKLLEILSLDGTDVTDAGIESLAGMSRLEVLDLSRTQISDACLETLKGMKNLRFIRLDETRVTCKRAQSLQAALPDARIMLENCKFDQDAGAVGDVQ